MSEIEFVPGLIVKLPPDTAPDYVICKLSIKPQELASWLQGKAGEWVNVDVKISKSGKPYAAVDSWKPQGNAPAPASAPAPAPAKAAPAGSGFDDFEDPPF
jgi:hypothetical protein